MGRTFRAPMLKPPQQQLQADGSCAAAPTPAAPSSTATTMRSVSSQSGLRAPAKQALLKPPPAASAAKTIAPSCSPTRCVPAKRPAAAAARQEDEAPQTTTTPTAALCTPAFSLPGLRRRKIPPPGTVVVPAAAGAVLMAPKSSSAPPQKHKTTCLQTLPPDAVAAPVLAAAAAAAAVTDAQTVGEPGAEGSPCCMQQQPQQSPAPACSHEVGAIDLPAVDEEQGLPTAAELGLRLSMPGLSNLMCEPCVAMHAVMQHAWGVLGTCMHLHHMHAAW